MESFSKDTEDDYDSGEDQRLYIKEEDEDVKEENGSMNSTDGNDTRLSELHDSTLKTEAEQDSDEDMPLVRKHKVRKNSDLFSIVGARCVIVLSFVPPFLTLKTLLFLICQIQFLFTPKGAVPPLFFPPLRNLKIPSSLSSRRFDISFTLSISLEILKY